ncbi:hypothetical protein D3C84_801700 [compost metagenome]
MADRGLGAQPEGIELRQPLDGGGGQQLGLDPLSGGGPDEALERQGIAAGTAIVGIHQDGELVARRRLLLIPGTDQRLGVLQHQRLLALAQCQRRQALLLAHRPAVAAALEGQLLQRQLAQAVVVAGQPRQLALLALAEDGAHPDPVLALAGQPALQLAPQLGRWLLGLQHADGLQAGQAVVAAGLGQQGAVIAGAQVLQAATEVDDAGAATGGGQAVLQVGAGGQQIIGMAGPVAQLLDDDIGTHIFGSTERTA